MYFNNRNTIIELQKEILPLQGLKSSIHNHKSSINLGPIDYAFPNSCFPIGAIHEFLSGDDNCTTPASGFIAGLLSGLMRKGEVSVWIRLAGNIFPPALTTFNVSPDHIIFIDLQKQKDILWVFEETLKYSGLAAVVAEMRDLNFTASRRFQLAVEQSGVTGFIIRHHFHNLNNTACVSRWRITSLPSAEDDMPGISFPRWNVELLKIRNGKPGAWQIEWSAGKFSHINPLIIPIPHQKRKTG